MFMFPQQNLGGGGLNRNTGLTQGRLTSFQTARLPYVGEKGAESEHRERDGIRPF
jgi:hypothetical protein